MAIDSFLAKSKNLHQQEEHAPLVVEPTDPNLLGNNDCQRPDNISWTKPGICRNPGFSL